MEYAFFDRKAQDGRRVPKAPLLITIGPQCAGKTTYLRELSRKFSIIDVAIDDESEVYEPIPVSFFRKLYSDDPLGSSEMELLDADIFGKSVRERIRESEEQLLIFKLFHQCSTWNPTADLIYIESLLEQFNEEIRSLVGSTYEANILIDVVRELIPNHTIETNAIELFVAEAIPLGVRKAKDRLEYYLSQSERETTDNSSSSSGGNTSSSSSNSSSSCDGSTSTNGDRCFEPSYSTCICWGNTNLTLSHFKEVLALAERYDRPVRFIRWSRELEAIPFRELMKRNILRFMKTGRYIPCSTLSFCVGRADELVAMNFGTLFQRHSLIAAEIGYQMDQFGYVKRIENRSDFNAMRANCMCIAPQSELFTVEELSLSPWLLWDDHSDCLLLP